MTLRYHFAKAGLEEEVDTSDMSGVLSSGYTPVLVEL
jgi:hypothetical protein